MQPYLFDSIRAYPLAMAAAIAVGTGVVVVLARAEGVSAGRALLFQASLALAGLFGGKLHSLLERDALHLLAWDALLRDGFRYPGALLGAAVALPIAHRLIVPRVRLAAWADIVAISIPFALVPMRIGCFLYGCCFGRTSHLPWALAFPPYSPAANYHVSIGAAHGPDAWSLPVHPLQLYLALWALIVGVALLAVRRRRRYPGQVALWFVAAHEGGKALLEFVRTEEVFQAGRYIQSTSFALSLLACACLVLLAARQPRAARASRAAASS